MYSTVIFSEYEILIICDCDILRLEEKRDIDDICQWHSQVERIRDILKYYMTLR